MSEEKSNELKEKVAGLQEELKELTPEELEQVTGGAWTRGDLTGTFFVTKKRASEY